MPRIRLLHNGGAGNRTDYEVPNGMTIRELFAREVGQGTDPGLYTILVNYGVVGSDGAASDGKVKGSYQLRDNDIVTFAANKIPGA